MLELIPRRAVRIASRALLTGVVLCAVAASARAGEYHVYSCRTPAGEPAPADGWSGSKASGSAYDDYVEDTCASGGALVAALGEQTTHLANVDRATWAFEPSPGDALVGATLWRAGYLHGRAGENTTYQFWLAGPAKSGTFDECIYTEECHGQGETVQPLSSANRLVVPNSDLGAGLDVNVSCFAGFSGYECPDGFGDPNNYAAAVYLYAADLILEQSVGPSATNVSGELASAPSVQGTSDVAFTATDSGAGVYEAQFSVDGEVVQSTVLDEDGGRCRNVGETTDGLPAFLYLQPCPASLSADVPFDTALVGNGSHHLVVSVLDAAGNSAPVLDREITVDNPPPPGAPGPPNGVGASSHASLEVRWRGTRHVSRMGGYGRTETVTGRLTGPGGAPIAGAVLDLSATPRYEGARPVRMAGPHTSANGAFLLHLPRGLSSCTLRFGYRSHLWETIPAVTRSLDLNVRAGLGLRITPRTASAGHSIFFSGRLRGGPIPPDGKQLVLEARSPGGPWLEFDVIRSDPRGRYRASYTFKFPGPADYEFRVVSEAEADYPYAWGASNVVAVFER